MDPNVQLSEPAALLLDRAADVTPAWLRRGVVETARRGGIDASGEPHRGELEAMITASTIELLDALRALLALDVDEQRTNPLSLFRAAVAGPTALLASWGVPSPRVDGFTAEHFPDDTYGLGPASWSDIDPTLQEVGITWGAWKAMTVLRRRRDEGLR